MGYVFSGVIAPGGAPEAMADLIARFGGVGRAFDAPFPGWAVAFQADHDDYDQAFDHMADTSPLVPWGAGWPGQGFAFIRVECFAGACEQRGFAFLGGAVRRVCDWDGDQGTAAPLALLLDALGVTHATSEFEPFTRNYFPPR